MNYLEEEFGVVFKDGVECIMMKMSMLLSLVMVEVDEVFNVIV